MRVLKVLKVIAFVVLGVTVFGFVTRELWNWLMPSIFGLRMITFWQAIGLVLLGKILFGGVHKHGHHGGRGWKRHMESRWATMSEEEREKFRAGMRGRCGGFGRGERPVREAGAQ
jgi:hypothetical protein